MQLEAGKRYTDRRGRVYGPLVTDSQFFAEQFGCQLWYNDGLITPGKQYDMDLVAEYVEPVQPESWYLHSGCRSVVLRVAAGSVTYFEDGNQGGSHPADSRCWILGEKITAEEARARIAAQVKPADAPAAPVESPDDWVTQDRVPARVGIDSQNWLPVWGEGKWRDITHGDSAKGKRHGYIDGMRDTLSLRCRRKDLPPVKPAVDPGEGYRLLGDDEITLPTDERAYFGCETWDTLEWANSKYFVGTTRKQLLKTWPDIVIRRRIAPATRTIVLKEWICWDACEPEAVTVDWFLLDPSEEHGQFLAYDHAHPTGNTRTVEIPVT